MRGLRLLLRGLAWSLLALCTAGFVVSVVIPLITGWVPLTILSGSMEPTYPVGSQVVVERVEGDAVDDLDVGDVITFLPEPESSSAVTHRIVAKRHRQDGRPVFTTRGDANDADDPWALTEQQIRGKVRYHVPYVGYVANVLSQEKKDTGIVVVALGLFGYALWQFARVLAQRTQRHRPDHQHKATRRSAGHRPDRRSGGGVEDPVRPVSAVAVGSSDHAGPHDRSVRPPR